MSIQPLTADEFKMALPDKAKKTVNQVLVDRVNKIIQSPETMEVFKENLLSYTHVIQEGRFRVEQYINAVLFVSFKMHGASDKDAYIKTFPEKYKRFLAEQTEQKDIASYISAYKKSKMVTLIYAQTLTPFYIVNADARQRALNKQLTIMDDPEVSPKVQCEAANSVLTHLKPPDEGKMELEIPQDRSDLIADYEKVMMNMVKKQKELIEAGGNILQITNASIKPVMKEADVVEVTTKTELESTSTPKPVEDDADIRLFT